MLDSYRTGRHVFSCVQSSPRDLMMMGVASLLLSLTLVAKLEPGHALDVWVGCKLLVPFVCTILCFLNFIYPIPIGKIIALVVLDAVLWGALCFSMSHWHELTLATSVLSLTLVTVSAFAFRHSPALHSAFVIGSVPAAVIGLIEGRAETGPVLGYFLLAYSSMSIVVLSACWLNVRKLTNFAKSTDKFNGKNVAVPTNDSGIQQYDLIHLINSLLEVLRRPLHAVLGVVESSAADPGQVENHRGIIAACARQMTGVVDDAHDLCQIQLGTFSNEQKVFCVRELVTEVVNEFREAERRGNGYSVEVSNDLPPGLFVNGDHLRLHKLLSKLLAHVKSVCVGPNVRIETWQVQRDGCPMLFEFEIEGLASEGFGGFSKADALGNSSLESVPRLNELSSGLNFAILSSLTQVFGGELKVSRELDRISFLLQAKLEEARMDSMKRPAPKGIEDCYAQLFGLRILIAEDHEMNATLLIERLESHGVLVEHVTNGSDALGAALRSARPDLILMDCQMPVMDGFEAARSIREQEKKRRLKSVPIIALTALKISSERNRCLAVGMDAHLVKPFSTDELARTIWDVLPICQLLKSA